MSIAQEIIDTGKAVVKEIQDAVERRKVEKTFKLYERTIVAKERIIKKQTAEIKDLRKQVFNLLADKKTTANKES